MFFNTCSLKFILSIFTISSPGRSYNKSISKGEIYNYMSKFDERTGFKSSFCWKSDFHLISYVPLVTADKDCVATVTSEFVLSALGSGR